jgi:two-component sensor histidine kinase
MLVDPFGNETCLVNYGALPALMIEQPQADAIALVVGELAVNSSKHGALAHGGQVLVHAELEKTVLTIVWNELCNRPIEQHGREGGKGMALMGQIMHARGGSLNIEWQAHGLVATLSFELVA